MISAIVAAVAFGAAQFPFLRKYWREPGPAEAKALVQLLKGIPARDFQAIDESCLMVSRSSAAVRASKGCPIG